MRLPPLSAYHRKSRSSGHLIDQDRRPRTVHGSPPPEPRRRVTFTFITPSFFNSFRHLSLMSRYWQTRALVIAVCGGILSSWRIRCVLFFASLLIPSLPPIYSYHILRSVDVQTQADSYTRILPECLHNLLKCCHHARWKMATVFCPPFPHFTRDASYFFPRGVG